MSPFYKYSDLSGSDGQRNLKDLYEEGQNSEYKRVIKLINKKPFKSPVDGSYCLDFKGRATVSSVKNMILVDVNEPDRDVLVLGKTGDHSFNVDVCFPLSLRSAMAIVNSGFDFKWISQ